MLNLRSEIIRNNCVRAIKKMGEGCILSSLYLFLNIEAGDMDFNF